MFLRGAPIFAVNLIIFLKSLEIEQSLSSPPEIAPKERKSNSAHFFLHIISVSVSHAVSIFLLRVRILLPSSFLKFEKEPSGSFAI